MGLVTKSKFTRKQEQIYIDEAVKWLQSMLSQSPLRMMVTGRKNFGIVPKRYLSGNQRLVSSLQDISGDIQNVTFEMSNLTCHVEDLHFYQNIYFYLVIDDCKGKSAEKFYSLKEEGFLLFRKITLKQALMSVKGFRQVFQEVFGDESNVFNIGQRQYLVELGHTLSTGMQPYDEVIDEYTTLERGKRLEEREEYGVW